MTPANGELLYVHSKECGSHEFTRRLVDGKKQYWCRQCNKQITEESDESIVVKPESRKAA